ncbi:MAG TPA: hypothetical protein VFK06_24415 [Candidatus Angelobacter sp.]|nr:hypothetical protein [Candidatus Angelobacter sp.]
MFDSREAVEAAMDRQKKLYVALALYAALAAGAWMVLDDLPLPVSPRVAALGLSVTVRQLALIVLFVFVVRTVLHWYAERVREERERRENLS